MLAPLVPGFNHAKFEPRKGTRYLCTHNYMASGYIICLLLWEPRVDDKGA